jgi:hypothetical protein
MKQEMEHDNFYHDGSAPIVKKVERSSGRRSRTQFDETKQRSRRSKNRGMSRVMRNIRRHQEYRMKILWVISVLVVMVIIVYGVMDYLKYSRINKLPPAERAAVWSKQAEKGR